MYLPVQSAMKCLPLRVLSSGRIIGTADLNCCCAGLLSKQSTGHPADSRRKLVPVAIDKVARLRRMQLAYPSLAGFSSMPSLGKLLRATIVTGMILLAV